MSSKAHLATIAPTVSPSWTRFPRAGEREPLTGASRATLYRWREAHMIVVKNVRRPGQMRGTAYISVESLMRCIEGGDDIQKEA